MTTDGLSCAHFGLLKTYISAITGRTLFNWDDMARAAPQHNVPKTKTNCHSSHVKHKTQQNDHRGSARDRGYCSKWDKFSKAFVGRNPLCEFCLGKGIRKASLITDHDLPHNGCPIMFWSNTFTALCKRCHDSTKQRMEATYNGDGLLDCIAKAKGGAGRILVAIV